MKSIRNYVFGFIIGIICFANSSAAENYRIDQRITPSGFEAEAAFLESVKWPKKEHGAFDANKAPHWNIDELAKYIPSAGIVFEDVNQKNKGTISHEEILQSLKDRKGKPFKIFAHFSSIYSIPFKQYSSLTFEINGDVSTVKMANWYIFTFHRKADGVELIRCEYITPEGD
jgi:hypothetical protein